MGFSDRRLAELAGKQAEDVRALRKSLGVRPVYKRIDTSRRRVRLAHRLHVLDL